MEKRYRIIISGKQLYKEIEISPEHKSLRFGTGLNCDVRVRRGLFLNRLSFYLHGMKMGNGVYYAPTICIFT